MKKWLLKLLLGMKIDSGMYIKSKKDIVVVTINSVGIPKILFERKIKELVLKLESIFPENKVLVITNDESLEIINLKKEK